MRKTYKKSVGEDLKKRKNPRKKKSKKKRKSRDIREDRGTRQTKLGSVKNKPNQVGRF